MTGFSTGHDAAGNLAAFSLGSVEVDGLGRLTDGTETLTKTNGSTINHVLDYTYDRMSQLTAATISNIGGSSWSASYTYHKDGNLDERTVQTTEDFSYNGNLLTGFDGSTLTWDDNGNLIDATTDVVYNYDNRLRTATRGDYTLSVKYAPDGDRVWRSIVDDSTIPAAETNRIYIVDNAGPYSQILLEVDPDNSNAVEKTYIYAHDQIIAQHDGQQSDDIYFYLHDRLGSVRILIDESGTVQNYYTYDPFGKLFDNQSNETIENPFRFAGYWWDDEISQYYCRARMYDPQLQRFTSIDPVIGKFQEPLTLHQYLYCLNNPINNWDPAGEFAMLDLLGGQAASAWARTTKFAASVGAKYWAFTKLNKAVTAAAAVRSGMMNLLFGPPEIHWSKRLLIGAIAGAAQAQLTMGFRGPDGPTILSSGIGGAGGGLTTSMLNEMFISGKNKQGVAGRISASTFLGGVLGLTGGAIANLDDVISKPEVWTIGFTVDWVVTLFTGGNENFLVHTDTLDKNNN